ncbi:MAG TPA: hypothetical protein VNW54_09950 [Granulicella sp.]|nr:hypothetical protein [Granulicella sp.]
MITGRRNVLEFQPLLRELAHRFGQSAAMHGVEHFLTGAGKAMPPCLLFVLADKDASDPLAAGNILGAALLYEFRILGVGSGVFVTEGKDGMRSIIAPAADRAAIAAAVSTALIKHSAQIVVASYIDAAESASIAPPPLPGRSFRWAAARRPTPGYLPLQDTLDQTLQTLHKKTRFNFRYYRRLLEAEIALEFVPDAGALLTLAELQALNRASLGPVPDEVARHRYQNFADHPGAYICGLRTRAGQWLSLIGGWRHQGTTVMQWQLNSNGYERFSLVTVARSYWMEHEISIGTSILRIDGGASHAMNHSCIPEHAVDLMLRRRSPLGFVLVKIVAPLVANRSMNRNHFLAKTLSRPGLRWRLVPPAAALDRDSPPRYSATPSARVF